MSTGRYPDATPDQPGEGDVPRWIRCGPAAGVSTQGISDQVMIQFGLGGEPILIDTEAGHKVLTIAIPRANVAGLVDQLTRSSDWFEHRR